MFVVDELTGKVVDQKNTVRVVSGYVQNQLIYGYVSYENLDKCVQITLYNPYTRRDYAILDRVKDLMVYSNRQGCYITTFGLSPEDIIREKYINGSGSFPYNFERRYEAVESFNIFKDKQQILNNVKHPLSDHLQYTFGLEFETSGGYIPEDICFRDGLIPLRDGSISGLEYSTVVLKGNDGLCLLDQQLESLRKYTGFNKECSLHIHMGGFPLEKNKLFSLYSVCLKLQNDLKKLVPPYTFKSSAYKASGKDYCKLLPGLDDFDQLYQGLVGQKFYGDFTQPHPNDIRREAKWRINTRYYWVNFINAFCYNVNKTIEFRLLRPSYNKKKIMVWLYIFNAILKFAEKYPSFKWPNSKDLKLSQIISEVYPEDISNMLKLEIVKLEVLTTNQLSSGDNIGADLQMEDSIFPNNEII